MAEGGPAPRLVSHLLECPICLKQLRILKSLPCLHSFCQDCLGTYITKDLSGKMASATSFPCPVCRAVTQPVRQADSKENWAEQYPTNVLVQEPIQFREQRPGQLYCKLCQSKENKATPATFWCTTMEAGFCEDCKLSVHDHIHTNCSLLDVADNTNTGLVHDTTPTCGKHNEKIDWYCVDHKLLGCSKCVCKDYRRCADVTTAVEYNEMLKNDSKLEDMKTSLLKSEEVLEALVKDFGEQLEIMIQNQDIALKSITDVRERINKQLDKLQKDISDNLIASYKEEKRKIEASLQQCERLKTGIEQALKSSATALERDDKIETILLYQRGQAEMEACKDLVTEMRKSFTSVSLSHEIDPSIVTLDNNSKLTLGKIVVHQLCRPFPDCPGYLATPLFRRRVKEIGKFNIKCPSDSIDCWSFGVVYLPDGAVAVGDMTNKKVKLFSDGGRLLDELTFPGCPRDMCLINNTTVAVAVSDPVCVHVVKVVSSKLSLSYEINTNNCYGIAYTGGKFVVSMGGGEVYSVTTDGTANLLHRYGTGSYHLASDTTQGDILFSHFTDTHGDVAVSRLSADKHSTVLLKVGIVKRALGIDVDREGNIYICGVGSDNVVQMSTDGTHVRELLTSSDGTHRPHAISVCGDKFLVTYHSISRDRNFIRVFQLY